MPYFGTIVDFKDLGPFFQQLFNQIIIIQSQLSENCNITFNVRYLFEKTLCSFFLDILQIHIHCEFRNLISLDTHSKTIVHVFVAMPNRERNSVASPDYTINLEVN